MTTPATASPTTTAATAPPPAPAGGAAPGAGGGGTSAGTTAPTSAPPASAGTFLTPTPTPTDTGKKQDGVAGAGTDPGQPGADAGAGATPAADIEIKLPEGMQADKQMVDGFKAAAKENGLNSAQAQRIADFFIKSQQAQFDQGRVQREQTLKQWGEAISADQEFGGAKLQESQVVARKAYAKFASPELQKFLSTTGLENHPEVARLFYRLGKADGEDPRVPAGSPSKTPVSTDQALAQSLYPNTKFPGQR